VSGMRWRTRRALLPSLSGLTALSTQNSLSRRTARLYQEPAGTQDSFRAAGFPQSCLWVKGSSQAAPYQYADAMEILVGYTPRPESVAALDFAIAHAKLTQARLTVLNTGRNGNYADPVYASSADIDAVEAELDSSGLEYDIRRPTDGLSAVDSLLGLAEDIGADLLVIGLRKRTPVGKLITGSTAQAVLLNADIPVVCVPAGAKS
jgi:nucleotide-binding universal stress UspA family protein